MEIRRSAKRPHGRSALVFAAAGVLLAGVCSSAPAHAAPDERPWLDTSLASDVRAQMMVDQMTLEEKSALLYGYGTRTVDGQTWQVYVKGNERLGIPDMVQGDAPSGVWQGSTDVTQLPNSMALGATFSVDAAQTYGDIIGSEFRALGYGVVHGPNVDVNRDPRHGRAHETMGEDPVLISALTSQYIISAQEHGIIADPKHFALNTVEKDRFVTDAQVDQKTMNELYLSPFQDVVQDAKPGMLMCAYTKINGVQACEDEDLLVGLLRNDWGFNGIVRTDAGAAHTLDSLRWGVQQEFRSESQYGKVLIAAVKDGSFPMTAVDDAVKTILRTMIDYGIFDNPPQRTGANLVENAAKAQEVAEQSIVLLKNDKSSLPMDRAADSVAVIGVAANDRSTAGGPANPGPANKDTALEALQNEFPTGTVQYAPGVDPIYGVATDPGYPQLNSGYLTTADGKRGADATYKNAAGDVLQTRVDTCLCNSPSTSFAGTVSTAQAAPNGTRSATWTSTVTADVAGTYGLDVVSAAAVSVTIDGTPVLDVAANTAATTPRAADVSLTAGDHTIEVSYSGSGSFKLGWNAPVGSVDANIAAAVELAKTSEVAVVVARDLESESIDRPSLSLPNDQDRLIQAVLDANPNTIVVLNTGSAVTMPWKDDAAAIVESWYGGTRQGAALAAVLLGDVNPSGRLPISFPETMADLPTADAAQFPGIDRVTRYTEGLSTGYRHYGQNGAPEAAFPFGFGLSYTTFAYSDLRLDTDRFPIGAPGADGTFKGQKAITASVLVTNTGDVAGTVTPQVYVSFPEASGQPAPLLKAFDKVQLAPGESRRVEFSLDQRDFSNYADTDGRRGWTVDPGVYEVRVADSSAAQPLTAGVLAQVEPEPTSSPTPVPSPSATTPGTSGPDGGSSADGGGAGTDHKASNAPAGTLATTGVTVGAAGAVAAALLLAAALVYLVRRRRRGNAA